MNETTVKDWFKKEDYEEGVRILEEIEYDKYTIELLKKFKNAFTINKLRECMDLILEDLKPNPIESKIPSPEKQVDFFSMPEILQRMDVEKSELFRETLQLRSAIKKLIKPQLKKVIRGSSRMTVKEACDIMAQTDKRGKPIPFSISVITADISNKTGGEFISWSNCTLNIANKSGSKTYTIADRPPVHSKNPNHWGNSTRNIKPLGQVDIRKIHIWLIFEMNGAEVTMGDAG